MGSSYHGGDPAGFSQSSIGFDYDEVDRNLAGEIESCRFTAGEAILRLLTFIIDSGNPKLAADVAAAGSGLALLNGWSYTRLAEKHGITKQAFDKRILKFQRDFQLPVTRAQKSPQARDSYRQTQLERRERLNKKHKETKERSKLTTWQNSHVQEKVVSAS